MLNFLFFKHVLSTEYSGAERRIYMYMYVQVWWLWMNCILFKLLVLHSWTNWLLLLKSRNFFFAASSTGKKVKGGEKRVKSEKTHKWNANPSIIDYFLSVVGYRLSSVRKDGFTWDYQLLYRATKKK